MVSFFIVFEHPCPGDFAELIEITEYPGMEYFELPRGLSETPFLGRMELRKSQRDIRRTFEIGLPG